jgi:hypothetical protein
MTNSPCSASGARIFRMRGPKVRSRLRARPGIGKNGLS